MHICFQAFPKRVSQPDELVRHWNKLLSIAIFNTSGKSLRLLCVVPQNSLDKSGFDSIDTIYDWQNTTTRNIKSWVLSLGASRCLPAALVPFPGNSFHLSQHFPALWKLAEAISYRLPQTIAHIVRPLRTAIIAFQVLKEARRLP